MESQAFLNFDKLLQDLISRLSPRGTKPTSHPSSKFIDSSQPKNFGSAVLAAARADLGVHEDLGKNDGKRIRQYFKNFGMGGGQDWCAAAVSTWMKEAGGGPIPGGVGARNIGEQFKQAGLWIPKNKITSKDLTPGNIVIWSRGGPDSWRGHIGVIESSNGKNFVSIEANSGPKSDSVVRNSHSIADENLLGIGILSKHSPRDTIAQVESFIDLFYKFATKQNS
jgi:hypothetical protein